MPVLSLVAAARLACSALFDERPGITGAVNDLRPSAMPIGQVHVVGVDDWRGLRGKRFGTILVNLETHKLLVCLPIGRQRAFANG